MVRKFRVFAFALLGLYAMATWRGWEVGATSKGKQLPTAARQSPGGYRTYVYWRGGK